MKKLCMLMAMLTAMIYGYAQVSVKYQGEVDLGYSVGVGDNANGRVNLHTIQGVKISDYFSAGVGFGADFYHEDGCDVIVPIFFNMKGYLPVNAPVTPYLSLDLGGGIGTGDLSGWGGFMWGPSIGIRYSWFKFQFGYTSQRLSKYGFGFDMNAIQFKVGVAF